MTLSTTVQEAMNDQIKHEFDSAYIYLSMAAYCESANLPGFAHWLGVQAREEVEHAMKFYGFIHDRGGRVQLRALDQPPTEFGSVLGVFEQALAHERQISGLINQLYGLAAGEQDYASQAFLQGFVTEQVEEEKNVGSVVETLKMVGDRTDALLMLDRELGAREPDDESE